MGATPASVFARALGRDPERDDSVVASLGFPDGSTASIEYLSQASPELPKERFEVSGDGRTARCENFRRTRISGARPLKTLSQDKGQATAVEETLAAVRRAAPSPFALEEIATVSRATFAILASIRTGDAVRIDP